MKNNNELIELILSTTWDDVDKEMFIGLVDTNGMNEDQKNQLVEIIENEKKSLEELEDKYQKDLASIEWEYKNLTNK